MADLSTREGDLLRDSDPDLGKPGDDERLVESPLDHLRRIEQGHPPDVDGLVSLSGAPRDDVTASLRRLHEGHGLVLHPASSAIWVAPPFSASPAAIWVATDTRGWWAPCIWCAFGIVALTAPDATIHARLGGEAYETRIVVSAGKLASKDLLVHFTVPARDAWKNVIHFCATVLPFESNDEIVDWCARHGLPRGAIVPLEKVLVLAREWYGSYLDVAWRKWTLAEARAIFERVGLSDDFWRLPDDDATF